MTPAQFTSWMQHMGYNRRTAAKMLHVGINEPKIWIDGLRPIPEHIDTLCAALALKVRPWSEYQKGDENG